jgi:pimeloyl-ACP methyl ester carboxylesterase
MKVKMRTKLFYSMLFYCIVMPIIIAAASISAVSAVSAQDEKKTEKAKAENTKDEEPAPVKKSKKESEHKGQSRELFGDWFTTKEPNPVKLSAMYYYGDADKDTTPVLLLHDIKGRGSEYGSLTKLLSEAGYAVLVPDLRGHGNSTKRYETMPEAAGNQNRGRQQMAAAQPQRKLNNEYKEEDFQAEDYALIFSADMPLLKKTLIGQHDKGFINMNRLVIVGAGRSAALAAIWAAYDWQNKDSDRFTKTLVLIAPSVFMPGAELMASSLAANTAIMPRQGNLPAMQQRNSMMTPAMAAGLADFTKGFRGNRFIPENLAVFTAIPQNDTQSKDLADKLRNIILNKDDKKTDKDKDKDAEKSKEAEAMFPLITYPTQKKVKKDDGKETTEDMKFQEILSSGEAHLAQTIFSFVNKRNETFQKENKYRWTRRK